MNPRYVAVIDIGKTNVKLVVVDMRNLAEMAIRTRSNRVLPPPPWPHFDVGGHWEFLIGALAECQDQFRIDAISVTTHGGSVVLLDIDGELAAPVLDYEHPGPNDVAADYDRLRPPFERTGSPRLAGGLNVGAQIHWQFSMDPGLRDRTAAIVTYPQYWGFLLTGNLATDVTSLGCHTDLWEPYAGRLSSLVDRLGIRDRVAAVRPPEHVLGYLRPAIRQRTGLGSGVPVHCGIHDSNASLLPHVLARQPPFSVVSTGTWFVTMAVGGRPANLDPERDTLVNVNALGQPVPSARFMGGREFEVAAGADAPEPGPGDVAAVLGNSVMLLPAVVGDSGPFRGRAGHWVGPEPSDVGTRSAAVTLYLALMTVQCLELVGHLGDIIVEGPLTRNRPFLDMLAVAGRARVIVAEGATGTSVGAALLACPELVPAAGGIPHRSPEDRRQYELGAYAEQWNRRIRES